MHPMYKTQIKAIKPRGDVNTNSGTFYVKYGFINIRAIAAAAGGGRHVWQIISVSKTRWLPYVEDRGYEYGKRKLRP